MAVGVRQLQRGGFRGALRRADVSRRQWLSSGPESTGLVNLDFAALSRGDDLSDAVARAYSYDGLGILTVSNIPGLEERRAALLPLAKRFAELPETTKAKYEHPESFYSFGWSHGKEKLQGKPDLAKGSFYANPQYDRPVDDEALIQQFTPFIHPNIWPTEDVPELEGAFKRMGELVVEVGALVALQCDAFVRKEIPSYPEHKLHKIIKSSLCCKARLLHYFATEDDGAAKAEPEDKELLFSSWCGWHNDHGSLTGLVPAMYLDAEGNEVPNPDPESGLYIRNRSGGLVKASMPPNVLGFQIGETAQIHSGGLLQATPHAVRGAAAPGFTRETFAVFMEPNWDGDMDVPAGRSAEEAQTQAAAASLPTGVPPLGKRWETGMDFGQFTDKTLKEYY